MKCPNCGTDVNEDEKICPDCGEEIAGNASVTEHSHEKKRSHKYVPLIIVCAVLIIAAVILFIPNSFFGPRNADKIVAEYEGQTLTNEQFNYYYWTEVYYYLNNHQTPEFDINTPLSEQEFDKDITWQEHFAGNAVSNWRDTAAVAALAKSEHFEMPEKSNEALDNLEENLKKVAEQTNTGSPEQYLTLTYGKAADIDSFRRFLSDNYYATAYTDGIYGDLYDELAVVIGENPTINVRHILIGLEGRSDEEASAKANEIYKEFTASGGTEEKFAEYAKENSEDPGSQSAGGIYTNVVKGQMVPEFDAWCFDASRKAGDTGIVKSQFGYHVMFFCGEGEPQPITDNSKAGEAYGKWLDEQTAGELKVYNEEIEIYPGQ